jgi:hypothetical protein
MPVLGDLAEPAQVDAEVGREALGSPMRPAPMKPTVGYCWGSPIRVSCSLLT